MIKIAPSILAADFTKLGEDIDSIRSADYLHFDVMDGRFVPNISFGLPILEAVRKYTDMTLDVHLMIDKPLRYVRRFCDAGADIVVFHVEADTKKNIAAAIEEVKACNKKVGLSLKPGTPAKAVLPFLPQLDMVLVMTVEPGFGGQGFMEDMMPKVAEVRRMITERGLSCDVEVDGGINAATAKICIEAGANVLVAGSSVFRAADRAACIRSLRG
ncbi:MAG: ribulose-phosphate 3-epimerase [Lachnospiraceae bacterium]|nr:ribulose-phosphate 3-epimerase [Lachnospiraceae bacterium]